MGGVVLFNILFASLSAEDQDFVSKIFEENKNQLYYIAYSILKNEEDAKDAIQETMYKIIKYMDKFTDDSKIDAQNKIMIGLRVAIRNTSLRHYRKKKRKMEHETSLFRKAANDDEEEDMIINIQDDSADVDEIVITQEECRKIQDALLTLSPNLQDAVNLVYYCDFSCAEAAKFLGIKDEALRNRLYQARQKLKELLKGDGK